MNQYAEIAEEIESVLADKERQRKDRGIDNSPGMHFSQKSGITDAAGEEVDGRTRAWRTDDGREVLINTAELPHHLAKRFPNGNRVFVLRKPAMAERTPLDIECAICKRANGYSRKFYEYTAYDDHQEILHPREWQREQRERDRQDRLEERAVLREMIQRGGANAPTESEAVQAGFICEECGKGFAKKVALVGHSRTHLRA